jgi:hypothetical protein
VRPATIHVGDRVRVTKGENKGLEGTVLVLYRADASYRRRAYVEFRLFDGPYNRVYGLDYLERLSF